jgi:TonB family protein
VPTLTGDKTNEDRIMRNGTQAASWAGVVIASLAMHAVAFGGLGHGGWGGGRVVRQPKRTTVEMTVAPPKAPPPSRAEAPRPAAPKARLAVARPAVRLRAAKAPPAAAPPAAAEALADFTGQTLTNDGPGSGWSSATGNGQKMNGPVGRPGARVTHRVVEGTPGGTGSGPPVVGLGDLSRAPVAPDLSDRLAAAYPPDARAKGVEGKAVVKARITAEGQVRELTIVSETSTGFGAACKATLRASAWTPPIDRAGHAVSTVINYTCRFNVE